MHIPDNYLSPSTCAVMAAAMVPAWTVAVKKVKKEIPREKLPMLGIGAAFTFLMMMFNVPLPGGTTGHAVGGTLLAILLGPYAACISISVALLIQALLSVTEEYWHLAPIVLIWLLFFLFWGILSINSLKIGLKLKKVNMWALYWGHTWA